METSRESIEYEVKLARAVLAEEESAIEEFADRLRCVPRILGAQNAKTGRPLGEHELADLVQDTIVVILKKLAVFRGDGPLEGWIFRICCLEFMNGIRRHRRSGRTVDIDDVEPTDQAQEAARRRLLERERIHVAIEKLGGVEAETIRMKHFEELTFEEIGARLGISPNTIKTRYYRGMQALQALLSAESRGEGAS